MSVPFLYALEREEKQSSIGTLHFGGLFLNGHVCLRRHHHKWKSIAPHLWCSRNRRLYS